MMSLQYSLPDSCISTIQGDSELQHGGCESLQESIQYGSFAAKQNVPRTTSCLLTQVNLQWLSCTFKIRKSQVLKSICFCKAVN